MSDTSDDEVSVVLRVAHASLDLDACRKWLPSGQIARVWRLGETNRRGMVNATSGFTLDLAEGVAHGSVVRDAVDAFLELAEPIAELIRGGADAQVDFGLFVDVNGEPFNLCLPPAVLAVFERAGVTVIVSGYPCSDEDDADEDSAREQ